MAYSRGRLAATLVRFGLVLGLVCLARPAKATPCFEAIGDDLAHAVFDALVKAAPSDGCTLENVATEQSQLRVEWRKNDTIEEAILAVPTSCTSQPTRHEKLSAVVPPAVQSACPAAAEATLAAIESAGKLDLVAAKEGLGAPDIDNPTATHRSQAIERITEAFAALSTIAATLILFLRWRKHRRELEAESDDGGGVATEETLEPRSVGRAWKGRPRWQRNPARAGWGAALLVAPHLVLGTWLLIVPDHLAFTAAQVVTLLHVGLAAITLPLLGLWTFAHVLRMRSANPETLATRATNRFLAGAVAVATLTGLFVLRGGDIVGSAVVHAACGLAVGVPLAAHLWRSPRKLAAALVAGLLLTTAAAALAARQWLPSIPAEAAVPAFDYKTRDASLYEPAANCGECHAEDYADWKRSTHARTLELPNVHESLAHAGPLLDETLRHVGQVHADPTHAGASAVEFGACGACHAPVTFYGDDKQSMLRPSGRVAEGVGCSFCHTLRDVHEAKDDPSMPPLDLKARSSADIFAIMSRMPFFVSAPETVRPYLFQRSTSKAGRVVANLLIRWRPEVHTRDYHAPVMDDSRACLACHSLGVDASDLPHMTYYGWKVSPFFTGDPKTTVECQDCHMMRSLIGAHVEDEAREVPWGPVRPRAHSHLLLGGNVNAAHSLLDDDLARQQHELNAKALSITIARLERGADGIDATAVVHSEIVGHSFPALETQLRYGWVELQAIDAAGAVLARTTPPRDSQDFGSPSPFIMASTDDPKPDNQHLVPSRGSRDFEVHLAIPTAASVDRVVAALHVSVDPQPIAVATWTLARPPKL
jgi:hypothetical protein